MVQAPTDPQLTWTAFLNLANTGLVIIVGFLLREAWKTIHARMDGLEQQHGDMRERLASLESSRGWEHPHRRRSDSGPHHIRE